MTEQSSSRDHNVTACIHVYDVSKTIFITCIMPAVSVLGLLGNVSFLVVLYRVPDMRTVTNYFLAHLAVSDGVLLMLTCTWHLANYTVSSIDNIQMTPFSSITACVLPQFVTYTVIFAAVFFVTLVTFERYFANCHPVAHRKRNGIKSALMSSIFPWLLSLLLATFILAGKLVAVCVTWPPKADDRFTSYPIETGFCLKPKWSILTITLIDLCLFCLAFIFNTVCYILIVCKLSGRQEINCHRQKARNHVARMLTIITAVFFVCMIPVKLTDLHMFVFIHNGTELLGNKMAFYVVLWLGRVTLLINAAANPFVYNVSNPQYVVAFKRAFSFRFRKTNPAGKNNELIINAIPMKPLSSRH